MINGLYILKQFVIWALDVIFSIGFCTLLGVALYQHDLPNVYVFTMMGVAAGTLGWLAYFAISAGVE